jgi:hypothetical protein
MPKKKRRDTTVQQLVKEQIQYNTGIQYCAIISRSCTVNVPFIDPLFIIDNTFFTRNPQYIQ